MHNTEKYLHTFNSGLICANKAARQLLCSSLLFCFREFNRFLEISVRDPRKILRVSRNSVLETRFSKTSRIENRVSSRDCQLTFEQYCNVQLFDNAKLSHMRSVSTVLKVLSGISRREAGNKINYFVFQKYSTAYTSLIFKSRRLQGENLRE